MSLRQVCASLPHFSPAERPSASSGDISVYKDEREERGDHAIDGRVLTGSGEPSSQPADLHTRPRKVDTAAGATAGAAQGIEPDSESRRHMTRDDDRVRDSEAPRKEAAATYGQPKSASGDARVDHHDDSAERPGRRDGQRVQDGDLEEGDVVVPQVETGGPGVRSLRAWARADWLAGTSGVTCTCGPQVSRASCGPRTERGESGRGGAVAHRLVLTASPRQRRGTSSRILVGPTRVGPRTTGRAAAARARRGGRWGLGCTMAIPRGLGKRI